jgi:hypothetical protein
VGAGPALAMGEFASQDASDIEAGFAKSGLGLTVNAGYRFINNIGVTASFLYGSHNLYPYDINGTDISNDASPWTYTSFLAGLWVTSHSKPFSVDGRIMAGFANATSSDYGGYLLQESAGGFALMAGAGVKYQIGSVLILTANADFFSTKVSFTDNGFDQPIGTIMITGGLGILLF